MIEQIQLPPGYGLRLVPRMEWQQSSDQLLDRLVIWEPPRKRQTYVLGVDVGEGIGQDYSNIEVVRVGTVAEPPEQVAQFRSARIDPEDLAYVIDVTGRFYRSVTDDMDALVAIECNGFGLQTQSTLIRHLGYTNLFIWQYEDAATVEGRFTRKFGWWTSARTRPIIVGRLIRGLKTFDPITGWPDLRINSPHTLDEMQDFQKPPDGALWDATAGPGCHDDSLIALAIANHVAQTLQHEADEPIADKRKRLAEESALAAASTERAGQRKRDWQNTEAHVSDMDAGMWQGQDPEEVDHVW